MVTLLVSTAILLIGFSQASVPWFEQLNNEFLRMKRDVASKKGINCILTCLVGLDAAFNKSYGASNRSYWDDEKYDEKQLDKLCKTYGPSSRCLNQCPTENFKIVVVGTFSMLEYMCISHNKEAKQLFPCLDMANNETRKTCDPKCQLYKQALKKWRNLHMTPEYVRDNFDELAQIFNDSCKYVKCEKDCSSPIITSKCGKNGTAFMDGFWLSISESLRNTTMIANTILTTNGGRGKSFPLCQN